MLDAISDFWKPAKKAKNEQEKLRLDQLQVGSSIGFGFVPQASLSGRRLQVIGINTYKFGDESLTSFVLSQDKDISVSMIVAESDGEQYLAISRRMNASDRMKMFSADDLENVMEKPEVSQLSCKDAVPEFKGWVVPTYKRELQGLAGRIFKGDFRRASLPSSSEGQEFKYSLLVSDSNEHAIEIEKYNDGRVEVYSTVYRRMSDVGEVSHPSSKADTRPDLKLASPSKPEEKIAEKFVFSPINPPKQDQPSFGFSANNKPEPIKLQDLAKPSMESKTETKPEPVKTAVTAEPVKPVFMPAKAETPAPVKTETKPAPASFAASAPQANASQDVKPVTAMKVQSNAPQTFLQQEIKAVNKLSATETTTGLENEAIECDLRVANKIIDEAIRNEMRLSDVVRRIIELPVAYPEAVHIPISLTDEDFSLLAIRYGISSADRNAIKRRIIEDLNDFSGNKKQQQKAA